MKRGRKRTNDLYFGPDEEEAVIKFLNSTDENERNQIFNEWLLKPFNKMIESIIRRYKLHRNGFSFEELHSDTISFLMTKVHKFETGRGKKAYSYFGTITKRYIIGLLIKDEKHMKQNISYEDISSDLDEKQNLTYVIDNEKLSMDDFMLKIIDNIKTELENNTGRKKITDNEKKVGYALIEILENWEAVFESMTGGSKYNKNSVLETMRNYTNLSTKDIRIAMKRYKDLYFLVKNDDV